jgi:membrane-bound lytic murein transglycosylase A
VVSDDLDFEGLEGAISSQRSIMLRSPEKLMHFGSLAISQGDYGAALDRLLQSLLRAQSPEEKGAYIRDHFSFYEVDGGDRWGDVLLTGYFEPILQGSLVRTEKFSQPLYSRPPDLVSVNLKKFSARFAEEGSLKGRLDGDTIVPFYTRQEIDGPQQPLANRGLELCWVDPVDAFFLHIQGSGTVKLADGRELFITYAEKNGQKYEAIGKFLKSQIAPYPVTMQRIETVLRAMSDAQQAEILYMNTSYVFFTVSNRRAITSMGVPATSERTIASDPRFMPKGALALLTFNKPLFDSKNPLHPDPVSTVSVSRLVLDQDTGGAIKGTDRIDLFWGRGDEAKQVAGVLQARSRVLYLVPKDLR